MTWFPPLTWRQRERLFFRGAALAIAPALGFLPAVLFLVLTPRWPHSYAMAAVCLPALVFLELWGLLKLVCCCVQQDFDLLTMLAFGALVVVGAIAVYTGIFLAVVAGNMF
ncbi:MAG TPA: hypothetical protein VLC12_09760 [Terriglobales bacterium]|nr:hypothetical protein [Terriglobales bacterium]